jgi:nicotinate dehydrogenase subunit A
MANSVQVYLNGQSATINYNTTSDFLLYLLREQFGLNTPRFGCGINECGCCTVLVNGAAVRTCVAEIGTINKADKIETLEGLGKVDNPHPMQQAFIDEQAGQCAFCSGSMIMGAISFINERVAAGNLNVPTQSEIADFLSGVGRNNPDGAPIQYICRCGAHVRIMAAIQAGAEKMI